MDIDFTHRYIWLKIYIDIHKYLFIGGERERGIYMCVYTYMYIYVCVIWIETDINANLDMAKGSGA